MFDKIYYCFYRIMANLTFGSTRRFFSEQKKRYGCIKVNGKHNIFDAEKIRKNKIHLIIEGDNNEIKLDFDKIKGYSRKLHIHIYGDNNKISIGDNLTIHDHLFVDLAYKPHKINNALVQIGSRFGLGSMDVMLLEDNSKCIIGDNCMFSEQIIARLSDTHSVLDLDGNLLNYGGLVEIGNHVWCGREARILKNVAIGDDSIIGASSVVTKRFNESNIVIGGNPAKIIKRGVNWSCLSPKLYLEKLDNKQVKKYANNKQASIKE